MNLIFGQQILEFKSNSDFQLNPQLIPFLLKTMKQFQEKELKSEIRKCLTLLGHVPPLKGEGIRVLSIDGGGTRGMMALEVLEAIERTTGRKICELFDYISGVSTGGIIAILLAAKQLTIEETRKKYMEISSEVFSANKWNKSVGLVMNLSMYNTQKWTDILKKVEDLACC